MKQSISNAQITLVTIILIGVVSVFGMTLVFKTSKNINPKTCCENALGKWIDGECKQINESLFEQETYNKCMNGQ